MSKIPKITQKYRFTIVFSIIKRRFYYIYFVCFCSALNDSASFYLLIYGSSIIAWVFSIIFHLIKLCRSFTRNTAKHIITEI